MDYKKLAEVYQKLENTTKRLEKTNIISDFLKEASDIKKIILLIQGRVYPKWNEKVLGVSSKLVLKAIHTATGINTKEIEKLWAKLGDLGLVAEELVKNKKQATLFSRKLSVSKVFENLQKLSSIEGKGSVDIKVKSIAELLTSASPLEAKYIIRTVIGDLRIGVGEGALRDSIVWTFFGKKIGIKYNKEKNMIELKDRKEYSKYINAVQEAYDISNDFGEVAKLAEKGLKSLEKVSLEIGKPLKVMLYKKAEGIKDAFEKVGKPAALEYKYDGFRLELHIKKDKIWLFTRRLDNVTHQFPDVVDIIKTHVKSKECILDSEVIGLDKKTGKWLPFQAISQRIKRKYNIATLAKEIPVIINVFDIMYENGKTTIKEPFKKRREILEKIIKPVKDKLNLAKQIITADMKKANEFYQESLAKGNEGIMVKSLNMPYKPGSRVGYGMKVKPTMESLDLVIVAAEWGQGKRATWLSSFTVACKDDEGNFLEIGKVGTGIKEKGTEGVTFEQLTKLLKPLIISYKTKTVRVSPMIVVEIDYEEIQKSPTYSSGYALRFPRVVKIREDKSPDEVTDLKMIKEFYTNQRQRNK